MFLWKIYTEMNLFIFLFLLFHPFIYWRLFIYLCSSVQFTAWVDAIIFVFSLENDNSFSAIYNYYAKMAQFRNIQEIPLILVGTQGNVVVVIVVLKVLVGTDDRSFCLVVCSKLCWNYLFDQINIIIWQN